MLTKDEMLGVIATEAPGLVFEQDPQAMTNAAVFEFCEPCKRDLRRGRATLAGETYEAFVRVCTRSGISAEDL